MIVDFQSHVFPEAYMDAMRERDGNVVLEPPDPYSGMSYLYDRKLACRINTAIFKGRDVDLRLEHMDRQGVDVQVVSIPAPGADRYDPDDAVHLARVANDALARMCNRHPDRFVGLATLPTSSVPASLEELDRARNELGLRGFGCFSNLDGRPLDHEAFFPIYEKLAEYGLPVYIHPTAPLATEAVGLDIMPVLIYGWAFDSTVAMTRLVYGRVLERFPTLPFVVADVGGVLAFFGQRAVNIYTGRTDEMRERYGLEENPIDSFRRFFVDTADHPASTLRCVMDFFGPGRMVFGTNYPYGPEDGCAFVRNSLEAIDDLGLPAEDRDRILGGNAARILGIGGP